MASHSTAEVSDIGSEPQISRTVTLQPYYLTADQTFDIVGCPLDDEPAQVIATQIYNAAMQLHYGNAPGSYREWDSLVRQVEYPNLQALVGGERFAVTLKPIVTVATRGTEVYDNEQEKKRTAWSTNVVGTLQTYCTEDGSYEITVPSFDAATMPNSSAATQDCLQENVDDIRKRAALYVGTAAEVAVTKRYTKEGLNSALKHYSIRVKSAAKDIMSFNGTPMRIQVEGLL